MDTDSRGTIREKGLSLESIQAERPFCQSDPGGFYLPAIFFSCSSIIFFTI